MIDEQFKKDLKLQNGLQQSAFVQMLENAAARPDQSYLQEEVWGKRGMVAWFKDRGKLSDKQWKKVNFLAHFGKDRRYNLGQCVGTWRNGERCDDYVTAAILDWNNESILPDRVTPSPNSPQHHN